MRKKEITFQGQTNHEKVDTRPKNVPENIDLPYTEEQLFILFSRSTFPRHRHKCFDYSGAKLVMGSRLQKS